MHYNATMSDSRKHSRRAFLQGKAAAQAVLDKAQAWVEQTTQLLTLENATQPALHVSAKRRLMACDFVVQFHEADHAAMESMLGAFDEIESLESLLTIYRDTSDVLEINRNAAAGPMAIDLHVCDLVELAGRIHRDTNGAFDITSTPLSRAWGFLKRSGRVPGEDGISEAMKKVGFEKVLLDSASGTIQFTEPGVEINFNSLGKGYALDIVSRRLDEQGTGDYLWHAGGSSVLARGSNRADATDAWSLGLCHPFQPERRLGEFHLRDQALSTAGGGTQFFEQEGVRYCHIIDPRSGYPAAGAISATVVAESAAEADALATAFLVMGVEEVDSFCSSHPEIGAVLICPGKADDEFSQHSFNLAQDSWTNLAE